MAPATTALHWHALESIDFESVACPTLSLDMQFEGIFQIYNGLRLAVVATGALIEADE